VHGLLFSVFPAAWHLFGCLILTVRAGKGMRIRCYVCADTSFNKPEQQEQGRNPRRHHQRILVLPHIARMAQLHHHENLSQHSCLRAFARVLQWIVIQLSADRESAGRDSVVQLTSLSLFPHSHTGISIRGCALVRVRGVVFCHYSRSTG
jgi:hypothetical protein